MEIAGTGLFLVGLFVSLIGWLMIVVVAFRESVLWGLGCLFIPLVALVFIATHWQDTKRGFLCQLGGVALLLVGVVITPTRTPKPVEERPVAAAEKPVEYVPASASYTPPPQPAKKKYVPPPAPEQPAFAKVYADSTAHLYYPADCATHPGNAVLISKTAAVMQGYQPTACK